MEDDANEASKYHLSRTRNYEMSHRDINKGLTILSQYVVEFELHGLLVGTLELLGLVIGGNTFDKRMAITLGKSNNIRDMSWTPFVRIISDFTMGLDIVEMTGKLLRRNHLLTRTPCLL